VKIFVFGLVVKSNANNDTSLTFIAQACKIIYSLIEDVVLLITNAVK